MEAEEVFVKRQQVEEMGDLLGGAVSEPTLVSAGASAGTGSGKLLGSLFFEVLRCDSKLPLLLRWFLVCV